MQSCIYR